MYYVMPIGHMDLTTSISLLLIAKVVAQSHKERNDSYGLYESRKESYLRFYLLQLQ